MPIFRDENILVVAPGSETTFVQLGLQETLTPPNIVVPTQVYANTPLDDANELFGPGSAKEEQESSKTPATTTLRARFSSHKTDEHPYLIKPIHAGEIVNVHALCYLLKLIYKATTKSLLPGNLAPLYLVTGSSWSSSQIEDITSYAFQAIKVPALSIMPEALGPVFGFGFSSGCVIDVGLATTTITPVIDFEVVESARIVISVGGQTITENIHKLLPDLSLSQCENLKKSGIYEVIIDEDIRTKFFGEPDADHLSESEEDGVLDVAAIVSADNAKELIESGLRGSNQKQQNGNRASNVERKTNTFWDVDSKTEISIGNERFQGCEEIIQMIAYNVGLAISHVEDPARRQDCWGGLCVVGRGALVKGFKEAILAALHEHFLVTKTSTFSDVPASYSTSGYASPAFPGASGLQQSIMSANSLHSQTPITIKSGKLAEYMSGWKRARWEDVGFLGAEIGAHQVFGTGFGAIDSGYLTKDEYSEQGPTAIWDH